jgi:hypothetical protein
MATNCSSGAPGSWSISGSSECRILANRPLVHPLAYDGWCVAVTERKRFDAGEHPAFGTRFAAAAKLTRRGDRFTPIKLASLPKLVYTSSNAQKSPKVLWRLTT